MNKLNRLLLVFAFLVAGCTDITNGTNKAYDATRRAVYESADKIQGLTKYHPEPVNQNVMQTGYCYKTQADIICFDNPQPHLSNKLVGYQGADPSVPMSTPQSHPAEWSPQSLPDGTVLPFYLKQSAYTQPSGAKVESSRAVMSKQGEIMIQDTMSTGRRVAAPSSARQAEQGFPAQTMPRF